ncbi:sushi, von Willebrand factor type A, EGF and pentraxin domain-containing protein 1-like [Tubulanus polymorphus]|uniref:sushi, von Willebrand factor type A, EGF and pentraxin domain-containing protein 1-like n=1 Tax=Tubulanus polymorphus TaxID=672921 RepID=UPI003DA59E57
MLQSCRSVGRLDVGLIVWFVLTVTAPVSATNTTNITCVDEVPECSKYARVGDCDITTTFVPAKCPNSCNETCACPDASLEKFAVADEYCDCPQYIKQGLYESPNATWVGTHCNSSAYRRQNLRCSTPVHPLYTELVEVDETYGFKWLSRVAFTCAEYSWTNITDTSYDGLILCLRNQTWIPLSGHQDPICYLRNCTDEPPDFDHSTWNVSEPQNADGFLYNTTATYTCHLGYELKQGSPVKRCDANSTWNGWVDDETVHCGLVDCGQPILPAAGIVLSINLTTYGSEVEFGCREGYYLENNDSALATCLETREWSQIPKCLGVDCGTPPSIDNGTIQTGSTRHPNEAGYVCADSHVIQQAGNLVCDKTGNWNGTIPYCIEKPRGGGRVEPTASTPIAVIIGGACGGAVILLLVIILIVVLVRKRREQNPEQNDRITMRNREQRPVGAADSSSGDTNVDGVSKRKTAFDWISNRLYVDNRKVVNRLKRITFLPKNGLTTRKSRAPSVFYDNDTYQNDDKQADFSPDNELQVVLADDAASSVVANGAKT